MDTYAATWKNDISDSLRRKIPRAARTALLETILGAWGEELQSLQDDIVSLIVDSSIDTATDWRLDRIGRLLDEARGTLSDPDYRKVLRGKATVLWSDHGRESFERFFRAFLSPLEPYSTVDANALRDCPPAAVCGQGVVGNLAAWTSSEMRQRFARLLALAVEAGVGVDVVVAGPDGFRFNGRVGALGELEYGPPSFDGPPLADYVTVEV